MTETWSPVTPGDRIAGKYLVDRVLGVGGMGVVVAATHEQLEQKVALKFLRPEVALRPNVVERFLREARASVKIHSEHVARVLDTGTLDSGAPYMVMEYLEGEDIEQVLDHRGPLPVQESVGYVLEACEAVAEAHAAGIVHRDLKPANLFLATRPSGKPIVKVLDFGISKVPVSAVEQALTQEATVMGSPAYMSPEQLHASRDADTRSDIWSLGVVLYELLTNTVPFHRKTMASLVAAVMYLPHPPIDSLRSGVPASLQAAVDRCLEKDPARRFADVAELARALCPFGPPRSEQSLERIEHVLGRSPGTRTETLLAPGLGRPHLDGRTLSPTTAPPVRPRGRLLLLPALVGLAGAASIAVYALRAPGVIATPAVPSSATTEAVSAPASAPAPPVAPTADATSSAAVPPQASSAAEGRARKDPAPRPAGPRCKVVSSFDAEGNKHFRQQCR